jgi:EAL domain-containing protein (putative c-di-GMP-specific phosphodiesterase class I)
VDFIPLAEETGLIGALGQCVLEEACRQARHWQASSDTGPVPVSVNLSTRQLAHATLVDDVARALRVSEVDPRLLELEITESLAMGEINERVEILRSLTALDVQLAIDDFGTGYSSMAYLKQFPVTTLKIDRGFVAGLIEDGQDASIVEAMVSLGHALRLTVVAEGIETAEQLRRLRALDCDQGQGYYFVPPLPPDQADAFLTRVAAGTRAAGEAGR